MKLSTKNVAKLMSYEIYMLLYLIFLSRILRKRALEFLGSDYSLRTPRHLIEFNTVWVRLKLSVPKEKTISTWYFKLYILLCARWGLPKLKMAYFRMKYKY